MNIDSQWFTCDKSKSKLCRRGQSQSGSSMLTRPHIVMVFICFYWIIGLLFKKVSCEAFGRWTLQSDFATWWRFSTVQLCRKTKGECNIPVLVLRQHGSKWFAWIERLWQTWKLLFTLTKVPWPVSSSGCSGSSDVAFDCHFLQVSIDDFSCHPSLISVSETSQFLHKRRGSEAICLLRQMMITDLDQAEKPFTLRGWRQSREESQGHQYFFSMWRLNHGSQIVWMAIFERMWHAAVLCQGSEKEERRAPYQIGGDIGISLWFGKTMLWKTVAAIQESESAKTFLESHRVCATYRIAGISCMDGTFESEDEFRQTFITCRYTVSPSLHKDHVLNQGRWFIQIHQDELRREAIGQ